MRVHLMRGESRTSISVDDQLLPYLQKRLGKKGRDAGQKDIRLWIQQLVDAAGDHMPVRGVSQWVQARIVDAIADPALKSDEKKGEEAELMARVRALLDQRYQEFQAREADRAKLVRQREDLESMARRIAQRTPRYRSLKRTVT